MIEGARELNPVARAAVLPPRSMSTAASSRVPVILRATEAEAGGARMRVGGLRVVDRAIRQLARLRAAHVIVADDESMPWPRQLPRNMERRQLNGDVGAALAALTAELGAETVA